MCESSCVDVIKQDFCTLTLFLSLRFWKLFDLQYLSSRSILSLVFSFLCENNVRMENRGVSVQVYLKSEQILQHEQVFLRVQHVLNYFVVSQIKRLGDCESK